MSDADRRRKWIFDAEEFTRGKIFALEDSVIDGLLGHYRASYERMAGGLNSAWARYVEGDTWSASDVAFRARTDALMSQIEAEVGALSGTAQSATLEAMTRSYQAGFAGRGYVLDQGLRSGVRINLPLLPTAAIRAAVLAPYRGLTFVDRFADARDEFVRHIRRSIVTSQIEGDTIFGAQKRIANELGIQIGRRTRVARELNQAYFARTEMIARTEILRSSNLGAMQVYLENRDVLNGWQWLLTHDERTCPICIGRNANNKVYSFDERETPPAHPRCRCTVAPVLADSALEQRIAGTRQTYAEWAAANNMIGSDGGLMTLRRVAAPQSPGITVSGPLVSVPSQPRGKAISGALRVPATERFEPARDAVAAIDRVHGDGQLTTIPIEASRGKTNVGEYVMNHITGKPVKIRANMDTGDARTSVIHETGHFLDSQAFGTREGAFASSKSKAFEEWRRAVDNSSAVRKIRGLMDNPVIEYTRDGVLHRFTANKAYVEYLSSYEETWARSYAQYIATRSGNTKLLEEIRTLAGQRVPEQWADDDFGPIADAIDKLFKSKGWIK